MALNAKQLQFVKEYLIDKNATRAAKAAGYSKKTAGAQGHDLLKKPEIDAAIEKGLKAQQQAAIVRAAKAGLTKERWLQELRLIALSNIDEHITIQKKRVGRGEGSYEIVTAIPAATKDRPKALGRAIKKIGETKNGITIELHSKQAALELLGKHYGWVKNEVELKTPNGVHVNLTMPDNGRSVKKEGSE